MAAFVLTNSRILVGSSDVSQFMGSFSPTSSVAMQERTTFGTGGFVAKLPGLKSYTNAFSGLADYDAGAVATVFNSSQLGAQQLVSVAPTGGTTAGDPASFTRALISGINAPGGAVGEIATFDMSTTSDTAEVQGVVAAPLAAVTSTGNGSTLTLAGPAAGQRMYAGLHITAASGTPSLVVKIQSSSTVGFGSPTDRITFSAATGVGWQWSSVAGAITDGYWRATFTMSGSTPSLTCAVVIGVA